MSKICQVTGKKPMYGNSVSHSHQKTRRRQNANINKRRFWVESMKRWVTLTVSNHGLRIINRRGIEKVVSEIKSRGIKL